MSGYLSNSDAQSSDLSAELDELFEKKMHEKEDQDRKQIDEIKEINKNIAQQQILKEIDKINITYEQIHIFHLKQKGLYNEEEEEFKKKQKFQSIKEIQVKDITELPIELNISDMMKQLFDDGILKEWENKLLFERFKKVCFITEVVELNKYIFWMILFIKNPTTHSSPKVLEDLKEKVSQEYTLLNTVVQKPKEEFLNPILFVMVYNCHKKMFEIFFQDRKQFNMRFILDCYHLVQFEINGVLTTDFYIQQTIDKYFSVRFLEYEKATKFTDIQKKKKLMERGRVFLGNYIDVPMPNSAEEFNFFQDIKKVLSAGKKDQHGNKQNARLNMLRRFSSSKTSQNTSVIESETSITRKTKKRSITRNSPNKSRNDGSIILNNSNNNKTQISIQNSPEGDITVKKISQKRKQKDKNDRFKKGQDIYENISPSLRIKNAGRDITHARLRFNLNHVSPTISKQIDLKDCSLQDTRKQVIFHPIDRYIKSKDYVYELEKMKEESLKYQKQIDLKVREQYNMQLINSEQMKLKVLKGGDQDMPSMDVISSQSDLSSQSSSLQFAKEIQKLKLIPKQKDNELHSQAQRTQAQYESLKQIKQLIDEQGTRVSDLPSTIQLLQQKNTEEQDEEQEQRMKILNRLYQQNQAIKEQTLLMQKEHEALQKQQGTQQMIQSRQLILLRQPTMLNSQQCIQSSQQINRKDTHYFQNSQQSIQSSQQLIPLNIQQSKIQDKNGFQTPEKQQNVRSVKVVFNNLDRCPSLGNQVKSNSNIRSIEVSPRAQSPTKQVFFSKATFAHQKSFHSPLKTQNSSFLTDNGAVIKERISKFGKQQNNRLSAQNQAIGYNDVNQFQQSKIKFIIEEKQKLDSNVQFLVLEQDEDVIGIDKNNRFSSLSPSSTQKNFNLKIVRPIDYKDKYNNIKYLIETVEDKELLKEKRKFGIKEK